MLKGEVRVVEVGVQEGDRNEEEQSDEEHSSSQYPQALRTVHVRENAITCTYVAPAPWLIQKHCILRIYIVARHCGQGGCALFKTQLTLYPRSSC